MDRKTPPKQTTHPTNTAIKHTGYTTNVGSKEYGPKASGPLPADPGKEGMKYGTITPAPGFKK